jgi:pyruvate,water dikinase
VKQFQTAQAKSIQYKLSPLRKNSRKVMNSKKTIFSPDVQENADGISIEQRAKLGAKGFNLVKLSQAKLPVPAFVILTPEAFHESLPEDILRVWTSLSDRDRRNVIETVNVSDFVMNELRCALRLNDKSGSCLNGLPLAVRSSSVDEDGAGLSYAGQFVSVLNVDEANLAAAIQTVWRSAFSDQVMAYRTLNKVTAPLEPPCVIVQAMIPAIVSGVAFGANPVTGDRGEVTISAVHGLGDKLVSGEVDAATYRIGNNAVAERLNESICPLTDEQLFSIKALVDKTGELFSAPQDIEWTIDKFNNLSIVQSRPITTLKPLAAEPPLDSNARLDIFDNSNIGESYPGMTTPLTFSFARKAYQHVYETFCRMMGVSESAIQKHSYIFPQMLGFVRGRIYYNLLNWYRLLSLFPGFKTNRVFMEQMMGVKAGLPEEFLREFDRKPSLKERVEDALAMSISVPKLLLQWVRLKADIKLFNERVEKSLDRIPKNIETTSTDDLGKLYRTMEQDLLLHWDAPIVNDFFAMVSFGFLRGICNQWFSADDGLHNQLLCGETGIVSTEPVARMKELAAIAAGNEELLLILQTASADGINDQLKQFPLFYSRYTDYLEKFGDRCTGELKLESPTVVDNPNAFIAALARLAELEIRLAAGSTVSATGTTSLQANVETPNIAQRNRDEAEATAAASLSGNILRNVVFNLVLNQTRTRIRERENLRFMRTRVFGAVRRIFVEIGKRFEDRGILHSRQDIFYLETEEILRFIEGTATTGNLKPIVESRKAEFVAFANMPAPPDRFTVRGGLNLNGAGLACAASESTSQDSSMVDGEQSFITRGLGCCPGTISGFARVIDDPNSQQLMDGEIMIAKRTDPGWITVIAQARGIVVEYGSLLSHTAIVARELGIPTIVSVSNVTTSVKSGDWLEINGATGEVRVTPQHANVALTLEEGETVKQTLRSEIETRAGFSFVRYAQCWEDTDIVIEGMRVKPGDTCVSIASAGDNSLALLTKNPGKVVALDLNASQLALVELKAAAFKHLSYDEMLIVLGYRRGTNRLALFGELKKSLSASALKYWNAHLDDIESGVASRGKFERYFEMFRRFSLPLTHSQRTVDELLKPKTREERERFFNRKWNTFRWRALFKVFFSEFVMGSLGRDPSFFTYADGGLPGALMMWTRKALVEQDPSKNPYLHWILKGEFGDALPTFIRKENFDIIKANIDKLEWHQLSLEQYLSHAEKESIDSFNLSDVFEYVSEDNYKSIMKLIACASKPGARVVYWNMMAPRTSKGSKLDQIRPLVEITDRLFEENQTFFYSRFVVEEVDSNHRSTDNSANELTEPLSTDIEGRAA